MSDNLTIGSVTGVDVHLRVAGAGARSYAFVIDWHIRVLVALAWFVLGTTLFGWSSETLDAAGEPNGGYFLLVILPAMAMYMLYHPALEVVMSGHTPGKRMAGIRIVTTDGFTPGVGALVIRNVLRLLDGLPMFYLVGFIATLVTRQAVRIGDLAAGTMLVYDDSDLVPLAPLSAEAVNRVGLQQVELIRDLLSRWDDLASAARRKVAITLLERHGSDRVESLPDESLRARLVLLLTRP